MPENPLISIITVCYNAEKEIRKTLYSLKEQSYKNFEHLVIDGLSSDYTLEIVKKEALPQTIVLSEKDNGLYDAMNKGLNMAKGKYVLFLNAGDTFHSSESLQHYAEAAKQDFEIIYGETVIVNSYGVKLRPRHLSVPEKLNKFSFSHGMLICHQAFMVKKALTEPYDLKYRFSSDYDWCINCIKKVNLTKIKNLQEVTIDYLDNGLTDHNKKRSLKERFSIMTYHYGLPLTIYRHFGFFFRALKRGKL